MKKKTKILFILPTLKAGGAERVITTIGGKLDKSKYDCTLIVGGHEKDSSYDTSSFETIFLNKSRILNTIPDLYSHIRKKQPDIVLGSISHVNRVLAMFSILFPKIIFVGREASVQGVMNTFSTVKRKFNPFKYFFENYFKYLDAIICQSADMMEDIKSITNVNQKKIHIINNPISRSIKLKNSKQIRKTKKLITVGRLSKEKGHARILELLTKIDFSFEYTIIGDGQEKDYILNQANSLGIAGNIIHIPYTNEVDKYLLQSDIFLQGSFVEGFPNALLESSVAGIPSIAFNAPGGTKEIIEEGINGFIVENDLEFIEKLNMALFETNWNPKKIQKTVQDKFNLEKIVSQYTHLFSTLISNREL